jgi:hypothetical protein
MKRNEEKEQITMRTNGTKLNGKERDVRTGQKDSSNGKFAVQATLGGAWKRVYDLQRRLVKSLAARQTHKSQAEANSPPSRRGGVSLCRTAAPACAVRRPPAVALGPIPRLYVVGGWIHPDGSTTRALGYGGNWPQDFTPVAGGA